MVNFKLIVFYGGKGVKLNKSGFMRVTKNHIVLETIDSIIVAKPVYKYTGFVTVGPLTLLASWKNYNLTDEIEAFVELEDQVYEIKRYTLKNI